MLCNARPQLFHVCSAEFKHKLASLQNQRFNLDLLHKSEFHQRQDHLVEMEGRHSFDLPMMVSFFAFCLIQNLEINCSHKAKNLTPHAEAVSLFSSTSTCRLEMRSVPFSVVGICWLILAKMMCALSLCDANAWNHMKPEYTHNFVDLLPSLWTNEWSKTKMRGFSTKNNSEDNRKQHKDR